MRKLLFTAVGFASACLISNIILPKVNGYLLAIVSFAFIFSAFLFKDKSRKAIAIIFISLSLGFLWNNLHSSLFISPAESLINTTLRVDGRVLDFPSVNDNYSTVLIRLDDDIAPSCKVLVTDYNGSINEFKPGDKICIDLNFRSARIRYNVEDDYYISSGIFLRGTAQGNAEVTGQRKLGFLEFPKVLAFKLKNHILNIFPEDVAPLMKALLTGDKSELYSDDELYVSLKKAGLSHIIAVSGMHVSFIISLISLIWGRRRMTAFIGLPLVWFFAAMMGFSPSVTRASLMISFLLLAPILRRENDPPTSLSAALLILLIINPKSIANLSLQLSFAAMAGIILITPHIYTALLKLITEYKIFNRILKAPIMVFSASIGALVFTTPIAALNFGYLPLYSLFANVLCLWAMSLAFTLSYPICIVGALYLPLGKFLASLIAILPRYTELIVTTIGNLPYSLLYTSNNLLAVWIAFVYTIMFISYMVRGKKPYRPIIPVCCCIISLIVVCLVTKINTESSPSVSAVDVGQGQCIVANSENATVVVDCGGRGAAGNPGDDAAEFLLSSGRNAVDLLVLTHLHDDHANGVLRLMSYVDINKLVMSEDSANTEYGDKILKACYDNKTEVILVTENISFFTDGLTINIFAPIGSEDSNEEGLIILGDYGEFEFLITGDAGTGTEDQLTSMYNLGDIELLVVGHHGSKYSTGEMLLENTCPDIAFIPVGVNSYGHPTNEVLKRLYDRNIEVYRTDLNGNLTVTVGNNYG